MDPSKQSVNENNGVFSAYNSIAHTIVFTLNCPRGGVER